MSPLDIICRPLGIFLYFIYSIVHNYGVAILIFTVLVKLVLLPLTVKQYKSSARMQEIQPLIQEVQKRYKNDKEKLNQELMKVYQENNYNPAGGCLPLIIQMPILISLYWVIIQPLKFMLSKTADQVQKIVDVATKGLGPAKMGYQKELLALNYFSDHKDALSQVQGALSAKELIDFNFLGLHLGTVPSYHWNIISTNPGVYLPLLVLPILAVVTTVISTRLSMPKNTQKNGGQNAMASSMTNSMMYIGPLMTLVFSFQLPAGVVLYWSIGYVFTIFQQLYINKHVIGKPAEAKAISAGSEPAVNVVGSGGNTGNTLPSGGNSGKNSGKNSGNATGKKGAGKKK